MMVRSSRVDQPPVSGVPVAGAKAGSRLEEWVLGRMIGEACEREGGRGR